MKSSLHDSLLSLLLHQQERLREPGLNEIAMPKEHMELMILARNMHADDIKVTPESVSLHPLGGEKLAVLTAAFLERRPPNAPMDMLIQNIKKENLRENISAACRKFHDMAGDEDADPAETLLSFHNDVTALTARRSTSGFAHVSDMRGVEAAITWKQANPGKIKYPTTGMTRLDRRINGWRPGYYLLGARPSVGKTSLAGNWLEDAALEGHSCAVFTWEMSADDYREKMLSSLSRVNISAYSDRCLTMPEMQSLSRAQRTMREWKLWINDDPDTTIDDLEAQSMILHRESPLTLIVIDYIQLVRMHGRMKRFEKVSEISNRVARLRRRLSKTGNTAIIALSQLKRVEGRYVKELERTMAPKPEMDDLRESGDLEQDADFVGLLHRDPRHEPEKAELIIAKNRFGPTGEPIKLDFHKEITRFKESSSQ